MDRHGVEGLDDELVVQGVVRHRRADEGTRHLDVHADYLDPGVGLKDP